MGVSLVGRRRWDAGLQLADPINNPRHLLVRWLLGECASPHPRAKRSRVLQAKSQAGICMAFYVNSAAGTVEGTWSRWVKGTYKIRAV